MLKEAVDKEIKYLKGDGLNKDQIEEIKQIHDEEVDLEFILDMDGEDDKADQIDDKIEREVFKTKEQKIEDFRNKDPNVAMRYGGSNYVF